MIDKRTAKYRKRECMVPTSSAAADDVLAPKHVPLAVVRDDETAMHLVAAELTRARQLHRPLASAHEAFAVILEEVDEFRQIVNQKREQRNKADMRTELVQIAAMAVRTITDLDLTGYCRLEVDGNGQVKGGGA